MVASNISSTRQWGSGGKVCRESLTWASLSAIVYGKIENATDEMRRARQRAQMQGERRRLSEKKEDAIAGATDPRENV